MRSDQAVRADLDALYALTPQLLAVATFDGRFIAVNPAWTRTLGWSEGELLARPYLTLVHPDDRDGTVDAMGVLAEGGTVRGFRNRYQHRDGSWRTLQWDSVAEVVTRRVYASVTDVTAAEVHAGLQAEVEQTTGVGTWTLEPHSGVLEWSAVTHRIHGTDPSSYRPSVADAMRFFPPDARQVLDPAFDRLVTTGAPYRLELPLHGADGQTRWVRVTGRPHRTGDGPGQVFGTITDITDDVRERDHLRHFEQLLELSEEGIAELAADGTVLYANQKLAAMLRLPPERLVGSSVTALLDPASVLQLPRWTDLPFTSDPDIIRRDLTLRRADASTFVARVSARVTRGVDDCVQSIAVVVVDIDQDRAREAALAAEQARSLRVLAATADGWWDLDLAAGTAVVSATFRRLFGSADAVTDGRADAVTDGRTDAGAADPVEVSATIPDWWATFHPTHRQQVDEVIQRAYAQRATTFEVRTTGVRTDSTTLPILVRGLIDYDPGGTPVRISGATMDLTDSHQAEQAKHQFLSAVSHELRTPLTSIGGSIELLRNNIAGEVPPPMQPLLEIAERNTVRLRALIDDLLDIERLTHGEFPLTLARCDLRRIVSRTIADQQPFAQAHHTLFVGPTRSRPLWVHCDAQRIGQVLTNLLSNAAKHAPSGSHVHVELRQADTTVRVSVRDRGVGVPEGFADRIFGRFEQADPSDRRAQAGTGLGLAISRQIVELHGGQIGYDSLPGDTSFWFDLPTVIVDD